MTDQSTTTGETGPAGSQDTPVEPEARAPGAPEPPVEGQDTGDEHAGSEAAKWRRRLRDSEAEVERLTGQLTAMQRQEVERQAGELMSTPADLWVIGTDMSSLLTDGAVDATKVSAAVQGVLAERPTWSKFRRSPVPGKPREKLMGGGDPSDDHQPPTNWAKVIGRSR